MPALRRLLVALLVTMTLVCAVVSLASADPAPDASPAPTPASRPAPPPASGDDTEVRIEPLIWLPTVDSSITIGDTRFNASRTLNGTVTPSEVLPKMHFNIAGRIEGRDGRWGGFGEIWYLNAGDGAQLGTGTGSLSTKLSLGQISGFYRLTSPGQIAVDAIVGVRIASVKANLQFNGARIIALTGQQIDVTRSQSHFDPLIGLRATFPLGKGLSFQAYGDYGGFGIGDNQQTWRAQGLFNYDMSQSTRLFAGYNAVNLASSKGRNDTTIKLDNTFRGPIMGVSFKL